MKTRHRAPLICVFRRWVLLAGLAGWAGVASLWGQRASNWQIYRAADGLRESSSLSVSISQRGNVWVKHSADASPVSVLDGFTVTNIPAPPAANFGLAESPAGQIWAVIPDGLMEFGKDGWSPAIPIPEIQKEYRTGRTGPTRSVPILPLEQDRLLILLSDALIEYNAALEQTTLLRKAGETGLERFIDMILMRDGRIWITGARGLARIPEAARNIKPDTRWQEFPVEAAQGIHNLQRPFEDEEGGITVVADSGDATDSKRALAHFDGKFWLSWLPPLPTAGSREVPLRQAWRGLDGSFWATTINSVFQIIDGRKDDSAQEHVRASGIYDVATETNGVFWLATSEGLYRNSPQLWRSPIPVQRNNSPVHAIWEDRAGRLWFGQADALWLLEGVRWRRFQIPDGFERLFQLSEELHGLPDDSLAMNATTGMVRFDPVRERFERVRHPDGRPVKLLGSQAQPDRPVYVQVLNGSEERAGYRIELFDGTSFESIPEAQPNLDLGPDLAFLFASQRGELWLASSGTSRLARYRDKKWELIQPGENWNQSPVFSAVEMGDGRIWFGTRDRVLEFDGRNWNLEQAGIEQVRMLSRGRDGVLVASNGGVIRQKKGLWISNGTEEGLASATVHAIHEDSRGRVWAATDSGISRYHPEVDTDPPRITYVRRVAADPESGNDSSVSVTFGARDRWNHTLAHRILYTYRLDDQEWSSYSPENAATFNELNPGKHVLLVRALDRNGNVDTHSSRYEFAITLPWYRETRLLLVTFAGVSVALFFAALALNRHRRLIRSYAEIEKIVAIRTQQLERANQELLHSQKMNALGTLAAGIAHDFNNILSIIKGSAQIIEANPGNEEKITTRVNRIKTVVDQGAGIVRAMLGFSRTSDPKMSMHDLNAVVEDTLRLLGDRFQRDVEIAFDWAPDLPPVPCIKDFVQQMLLNFIFNAADAMEGHGRILLKTGQLMEPPSHMVLPPAAGDHYVYVEVRDKGSGIAPEILPRIFEPFFTTKALSSRRGTGLGLSMVYELARQIGCGLTVESEVGAGSVFTVILPVRPLPPPTAAGAEKAEPKLESRGA